MRGPNWTRFPLRQPRCPDLPAEMQQHGMRETDFLNLTGSNGTAQNPRLMPSQLSADQAVALRLGIGLLIGRIGGLVKKAVRINHRNAQCGRQHLPRRGRPGTRATGDQKLEIGAHAHAYSK